MTGIATPTVTQRRSTRAMGSSIEIILDPIGGAGSDLVDAAFDSAFADVARLESVMSRFDPTSELSALNRSGAARVSGDLLDVVERALSARTATSGRFDPTIREAMISAGYDRSFDELEGADVRIGRPAPGGGGVTIDRSNGVVTLDAGVTLDLGAIGKGFTADRLAMELSRFGSGIVDMGGDLRVFAARDGNAPEWTIGLGPEHGGRGLALRDGGVATSGRDRRRWLVDGRQMHHVIDPRTGVPATTDLLRVTVVAATCVDAEVRATQLLLAGLRDGRRIVEEDDLLAVFVSEAGAVEWIGGWNG